MNSYNIADVNRLKILFEQAFSSGQDTQQTSNYDEYIALIAEGRIDLLPPSVRQQVLDQIAYDPDSAALLKALNAIEIATDSSVNRRGFRVISTTWAVAATLMFGLFMWRVIVPPPVGYSFRDLSPYSTRDLQDQYWSQAQQQRLVMDANSSRWRDYALIGSVVATCILSVVLLTDRLRRK